jgi:Fuc2NAc and GlcNAc transferase
LIQTSILILIVVAAAGNYFFTGWFLRYAIENHLTDIPNNRSSHDVPKPRGGGVGFVLFSLGAFFIYFIINGYLTVFGILIFLITTAGVAVLGWYDDKKNLSVSVRFGIQLIAAVSVLIFVSGFNSFYVPMYREVSLGIAGFIAGVIWLTGSTNIYNFMDGVDGIASVQAIFAGTGWAFLGWYWGMPVIFVMNIILVTAVLSFLIYNWSPAKIFMGDVGSIYLGFYFASMPFLVAHLSDSLNTGFTVWISALLLWPFLYDGSFTLIKRAYDGKNIFKPHRTHLYQRLNRMGWPHTKVTLLYAFFSMLSLFLMLVFIFGNELVRVSVTILLFLLSFYFTYLVFNWRNRYKQKRVSS